MLGTITIAATITGVLFRRSSDIVLLSVPRIAVLGGKSSADQGLVHKVARSYFDRRYPLPTFLSVGADSTRLRRKITSAIKTTLVSR